MDFIYNLVSYFYPSNNNTDNINEYEFIDKDVEEDCNKYDDVIDSIELVEFTEPTTSINKYDNVSKIIRSNILLDFEVPKPLYNPSGIINIYNTREYYKSFVPTYYNYDKCRIFNRQNIFTEFYVLNVDKENIVNIY